MPFVWTENIAVDVSILDTNINEIQDNIDWMYTFLTRNHAGCAGAAWTEHPVNAGDVHTSAQPVQLRERIDDLRDNWCTLHNIGENVGALVGEDVGANIGEDTGENVGEDTGENVGANTGANTGEKNSEDSGENVGADTGENVGANTSEDIGANSGAETGAQASADYNVQGSDDYGNLTSDEYDNVSDNDSDWGGANCGVDRVTVFDIDGCFSVNFDDH